MYMYMYMVFTSVLCIYMYSTCSYIYSILSLSSYSTKNTILKKYDGRFKDIFEEIYERQVFTDWYTCAYPGAKVREIALNYGGIARFLA